MKLIGYAALDAEGQPFRPKRSGYSWEVGLTSPPRIYTTAKKAETYSPVGKHAEVYVKVIEGVFIEQEEWSEVSSKAALFDMGYNSENIQP